MIDITKLPDRWRDGKPTRYVERDNSVSFDPKRTSDVCADELEAALPKWTKITDEDITEDPIILYGERGSISYTSESDLFSGAPLSGPWLRHCGYTHWRPLCDLDYPPEQS